MPRRNEKECSAMYRAVGKHRYSKERYIMGQCTARIIEGWEHLDESTPSNAIGEKLIVYNREVNGGMRKQKSL